MKKLLDPSRKAAVVSKFEKALRHLIVGQDGVIEALVFTYQVYLAGIVDRQRPIANFLFLGPTGTGKTRTVEAVAEVLAGSPEAMVKINCGEFQHSHEIAKLIGSPPGYLGHRITHPLLSPEMLSQYRDKTCQISFVLFDEIEKASDALWNLLLGIMDKAALTLGDNRRVDFSQTMIFLTSNLGAKEMAEIVRPKMGFAQGQGTSPNDQTNEQIQKIAIEAARRKFTPEFMNRLDRIVVFRTLEETALRAILELELDEVQRRIVERQELRSAFLFWVTKKAKDYLLGQGIDPRYGARYLKRTIERLVVQPLSSLVVTRAIQAGDLIKIDLGSGSEDPPLVFIKVGTDCLLDQTSWREIREALIKPEEEKEEDLPFRTATAGESF